MTDEVPGVFAASMVRYGLYFLRMALTPILLMTAVVLFAPWPRMAHVAVSAMILVFAVLLFPLRQAGARLRADAGGIACLYRDGKVQSMAWEDITHFNRAGFHVRVMDKRRGPMLHAYAWPLLIRNRREFIDLLRRSAPHAIEVSSIGWWKLVFDHLRSFLARSR